MGSHWVVRKRGKVCGGEGGQTSGHQEAGRSWGRLVGHLEEVLEGGQEEQAAGYQEEGITGDQVKRLV